MPKSFKRNLNYEIGSYGHLYSRIKDIEKAHDIDILFLGSSHVYRGIDPRIFKHQGLSIFNLGSSAQTPIQTELLLKRYLKQLHPKLIIYDIYPESFDSDGVESSLDIISNSKNDLESIKMALKINNIKTYNALIYGFYRDLFGLNVNYVEPKVKNQDTYVNNGFVERALHYNSFHSEQHIKWSLKSEQVCAFNQVLNLIKQHDIPYIFIEIPVTKARYNGYKDKNKFDAFIRNKGDYYNFNELMDLNDSLHFYDTQHLNSEGVERFDNQLIETILKK